MGRKIKLQKGKRAAVEAAGGVAALARKLKITTGAVSQWQKIPAERVVEVERVTGVPRNVQRPDLYEARALA